MFAPLIAKHVLGVGDGGYALMVSMAGVGAFIGLLSIASVPPLTSRGRLMLVAMGTLGVLLVAFGLSTYGEMQLLTFAIIGAVGLLQSSLFAVVNTVLMELARPHMRGRIVGLISLDRSMITAGGVVGGALSAAFGPQVAQVTFGAACVAVAIALAYALPTFRSLK
jgi:MFS family permease